MCVYYLYKYTCDIYICLFIYLFICVYVSEKYIHVHKYKLKDRITQQVNFFQ